MKLALIGVGQAGGKIVDALLKREEAFDPENGIIEHALAINTAQTDLGGLQHVPEDRQILIGETEVGGHGTGGDSDLAAEIANTELDELESALTPIAIHRVDAFLVIAGLGGGTGGGVTPVLTKRLQELYEEPVYGLGVLPAVDEGGIYTLNAARCLKTVVGTVDSLILFDNDAWRSSGEAVDVSYEEMNAELVKQLEPILRAGELREDQQVAESVVDTSDIINTLSGGGITVIGYAEDTSVETVDSGSKGLLARFRGDDEQETDSAAATNRITSLIRQATRGRLTVAADVSTTERGLVIVAGPSQFINRKGIERGRTWLEEETGSMHIRGGDYPWNREVVAVSIVLSGVSAADRIERLKAQAVEAQESLEAAREEHADPVADLSAEELDSLL